MELPGGTIHQQNGGSFSMGKFCSHFHNQRQQFVQAKGRAKASADLQQTR